MEGQFRIVQEANFAEGFRGFSSQDTEGETQRSNVRQGAKGSVHDLELVHVDASSRD